MSITIVNCVPPFTAVVPGFFDESVKLVTIGRQARGLPYVQRSLQVGQMLPVSRVRATFGKKMENFYFLSILATGSLAASTSLSISATGLDFLAQREICLCRRNRLKPHNFIKFSQL